MRVVHYLNQFFGGIGAEEQAGMGLEARDGAVGPGKLSGATVRRGGGGRDDPRLRR